MGVDPQTGMYTPDVSYQPLGAMGGAIQLLNAQKAQQIADALQQQREAQASLESQQAQQYGLAAQRAEAARQAVGGSMQNPSSQPMDWLRAAGPNVDIKDLVPLARASESAGARLGAAALQAEAGVAKVRIANGEPVESVRSDLIWKNRYDPSTADEVINAAQSQIGQQPQTPAEEPPTQGPRDTAGLPGSALQGPPAPGGMGAPTASQANPYTTQTLPVAAAKAAALNAGANKANTQATDITATRPSRINENQARADYLQAQKALAQAKVKAGLTAQEGTKLWGHVVGLANQIRLRENNLAKEGDEVYEGETAAMKQTYAGLVQQAQRSGAPPPAGFTDIASYKPFAGTASPAPGGTAPGGNVTRQITLPPVPGQ